MPNHPKSCMRHPLDSHHLNWWVLLHQNTSYIVPWPMTRRHAFEWMITVQFSTGLGRQWAIDYRIVVKRMLYCVTIWNEQNNPTKNDKHITSRSPLYFSDFETLYFSNRGLRACIGESRQKRFMPQRPILTGARNSFFSQINEIFDANFSCILSEIFKHRGCGENPSVVGMEKTPQSWVCGENPSVVGSLHTNIGKHGANTLEKNRREGKDIVLFLRTSGQKRTLYEQHASIMTTSSSSTLRFGTILSARSNHSPPSGTMNVVQSSSCLVSTRFLCLVRELFVVDSLLLFFVICLSNKNWKYVCEAIVSVSRSFPINSTGHICSSLRHRRVKQRWRFAPITQRISYPTFLLHRPGRKSRHRYNKMNWMDLLVSNNRLP